MNSNASTSANICLFQAKLKGSMRVWRNPKEGVISNNFGTTGIALKCQERH
jgi:hypothetical protein